MRTEKIQGMIMPKEGLAGVFPSQRSGAGHLTTVAKLFREARDKAGLPKNLVLFCSRHDYETRVLQETGNLAAVILCRNQKLGKLLI